MNDMKSGESDWESSVATVKPSLSVTAYSGVPLASPVTKKNQESDTAPFFLSPTVLKLPNVKTLMLSSISR